MTENIFNFKEINGDEICIGNETNIHGNGLIHPENFIGTLDIPEKINNRTVTVIGKYAFCNIENRIDELILPSTIREIQYMAFDICFIHIDILNLSNIEILGQYCFSSNDIINIILGPHVRKIEQMPFPNNPNLESLKVDLDNEYYSNDFQYCLYNKEQTILIQAPMKLEKIIIPNTVKEICGKAFEYSAVKELIIPERCDTINREAIKHCKNLTTIYIYSTLSHSSEGCFHTLISLSEVYYLNNVAVTENVFTECPSDMTIYTCNSYSLEKFANMDVNKTDWTCQSTRYITCQNTNHNLINLNLFAICLTVKH